MKDKGTENENRKKQDVDRRKSEIRSKLTSSITPSQIAMLQSDLNSLISDAQSLDLDLSDFIALQNSIQATMQKQLSLAEIDYVDYSQNKNLTDQEIINKMVEHRKNFESSLDKYHQSINHSQISATHQSLGSGKVLDDVTMKAIRVDEQEYEMRKKLKKDRAQLDEDYRLAHSRVSGFEQEIQRRETEIENLEHKLRQNPDDRALYREIKAKKDELKNIENNHMKAFDDQVAANDQTLQSKKPQLLQIEESDKKRFDILSDQQKLKQDARNAEAEKRLQETRVSSNESPDVTKLKEQRQEEERVREQRRKEREAATKIQALIRGRQARQQAQSITQNFVVEIPEVSSQYLVPSSHVSAHKQQPQHRNITKHNAKKSGPSH